MFTVHKGIRDAFFFQKFRAYSFHDGGVPRGTSIPSSANNVGGLRQ